MTNTIKDKVCSFKSLYKAMNGCKRGVGWKDSVVSFCYHSTSNINRLRNDLINDKYKIKPYIKFVVYEPKERHITATSFVDRVFQKSLCDNYLYEEITKHFIYDNCACQKGKGTDFARNRLKVHLQKFGRKYFNSGFILKCDISHFFEETDHKVAYDKVSAIINDKWVLNHVKLIIDSFGGNKGIGLGSQVAQLIQLNVLNDLDHFVKEKLRIKHYIRYMDDFILIHPDKQYLKYCKNEIDNQLKGIKLSLNKKKTRIIKLSNNFEFLGFKFKITDTGKVLMVVDKKKVKREKRRLKKQLAFLYNNHHSKKTLITYYNSWLSNAKKGKNYYLIQNMNKYVNILLSKKGETYYAI